MPRINSLARNPLNSMPEVFMFRKTKIIILVLAVMIFGLGPQPAATETECGSFDKKSIKVEGWISKKFRKQKKAVSREFAEMGHTRVVLRVFPMGDTAKVVAIGRCVPAPLAQHLLRMALKYTGGVEDLVNQAFISPHWFGVGTTLFDEPSQQKVTGEQVRQLLDPSLSTEEFHALYRKLSVQDELVPYFGLQRPNAKKVD
ncbi:MAG: hypothetical protein ACE5E9_13695 [Nitrospinaceae bacterium]